jgi:hypothetical protein
LSWFSFRSAPPSLPDLWQMIASSTSLLLFWLFWFPFHVVHLHHYLICGRWLHLQLHYYCFDCFGFPFRCLHLPRHALYFLLRFPSLFIYICIRCFPFKIL